ncbi:D-arabinose 1-dehydrogenase-like Zn-dependent alcohol dehydrogenase [Compostimonas suwonensis]|uniref:alcohol dehydrogenase n=2 Tax=Compostimonas suwonensis TaxID=1048394 RepID=A0A2M9BU83_9MICO|nr:D-arabinose 1-dehydrogenase-like Zn-dependent alcohol dehydrogenase [Compostimonas suwonensis]
MAVMALHGHGGPSVIGMERIPVPRAAPGEFRVRVLACGVCGHDALARSGRIPSASDAVLGHEIAGVVDSVGDDSLAAWLGRRVALVQRRPCGVCADCLTGSTNQCRSGPGFYGDDVQGGYAEFVLADPLNAVLLPDSIDDATGAVLSCGVGTGFRAINASGCGSGDALLITGSAGGVGLNAVALAASRGISVFAATSSEAKGKALLEAGAVEVLVRPDAGTVRAAAARHGFRRGVNAVLELTGAPTFALAVRSLAPRGRVVLVGNVDPRTLGLEGGLVIVKELSVTGSAHATREDLEAVVELVASGALLSPRTHSRPLREVVAAHAALDARTQIGRTVVIP